MYISIYMFIIINNYICNYIYILQILYIIINMYIYIYIPVRLAIYGSHSPHPVIAMTPWDSQPWQSYAMTILCGQQIQSTRVFLPAMTGNGKSIPPIKMVNYCMIFYGHERESFFGNIYGISMDDLGMVNMALWKTHIIPTINHFWPTQLEKPILTTSFGWFMALLTNINQY